jgi:HSP20 family protein
MFRRIVFDDLFHQFRDVDRLFHRAFHAHFPRVNESDRLLPSRTTHGTALVPLNRGVPAPSIFGGGYFPATESYQKDGRLILRAELPGVDPKSLEITLTGNRIVIKGEKKSAREVEESDVFFSETSHGTFERSFRLPKGVKGDDVKATFENGVMEISLPMPSEAEPKQVKIDVK